MLWPMTSHAGSDAQFDFVDPPLALVPVCYVSSIESRHLQVHDATGDVIPAARLNDDILGHGNENCLLPGTLEHRNGQRTEEAGGLIFTEAEIEEFKELAAECGASFDTSGLKTV